jgi:hypothetical protein
MKRPGYSLERPGRLCFQVNYARRRLASWLLVVPARIESIFRRVCPNLDKVPLLFVAQLVAQFAEGLHCEETPIQRLR